MQFQILTFLATFSFIGRTFTYTGKCFRVLRLKHLMQHKRRTTSFKHASGSCPHFRYISTNANFFLDKKKGKSAILRPGLPFYGMIKRQCLCKGIALLPFQKVTMRLAIDFISFNGNLTTFNHLNTEFVRYSDLHCNVCHGRWS